MGCFEKGVVEGQLLHLARRDLGQFVAAIADVDAPQARHAVNDLMAVAVFQPDTFGRRNHARFALGKRVGMTKRVQVVRGIERLKFSGRGVVCNDVHRDLWVRRSKVGGGVPKAKSRAGIPRFRRL